MATILQEPNKNNSAYAHNVWVIGGAATGERYVLTIKPVGYPEITFKQPANPEGVGIFDVSKVLQSFMQPTFNEGTLKAAGTPLAHLSYQVAYNTEAEDGTPGVLGLSTEKNVINAYDNWRVINSDLTPFIPNPDWMVCETESPYVMALYPTTYRFLTNWQGTYVVRADEWKTLSFYNRILDDGPTYPNWGPNYAPFWIKYTFYNGAVITTTQVHSLSADWGMDVRSDCNDKGVVHTADNIIGTIGVGPANLAAAGLLPGSWDRYEIGLYAIDACKTGTISDCEDIGEILDDGWVGDLIYQAAFELDASCEKFEPVTVSFMNQYGVKDYYTFTKRNTRQVATDRTEYTKTLGTWSADTFSIGETDRGRKVFSSTAKTEMTLMSDWLTDAQSLWLKEMFASPSVNIYIDGQWEPCVLTTATYEEKTYARNFLFQHEITLEYANNQKIQRG